MGHAFRGKKGVWPVFVGRDNQGLVGEAGEGSVGGELFDELCVGPQPIFFPNS
jgi:hypothetical protein